MELSRPPRFTVVQLHIKEKTALYTAYIPFFTEGGVFVPTDKKFRLGDDVHLLLSLPEEKTKYPIAGKVGWVTPAGAGHREQGVGVHFPKAEQSA